MVTSLVAPISEADYRTFALLPMPEQMTGIKAIQLLNQAWDTVRALCDQPLDSTANVDMYPFPDRYCNVGVDGLLHIQPKYLPLISVTSMFWSNAPALYGWTSMADFDMMDMEIIGYSCPFVRGDHGFIKVNYSSGYSTIPDALKAICAQMTAHLLSGGYTPTIGGVAVLSEYLNKDFWKVLQLYKRVR